MHVGKVAMEFFGAYSTSKHSNVSLHFFLLFSVGKVAMEFFGAYSMSKHSIEAYSDALRQEMFKWGVKVSIIQPSGFATGTSIGFF